MLIVAAAQLVDGGRAGWAGKWCAKVLMAVPLGRKIVWYAPLRQNPIWLLTRVRPELSRALNVRSDAVEALLVLLLGGMLQAQCCWAELDGW